MRLSPEQKAVAFELLGMVVAIQSVKTWEEWKQVAERISSLCDRAMACNLPMGTTQKISRYGMTGDLVHEPDCDWNIEEKGMTL